MDRSDIVTLVAQNYTVDEIGQRIATSTPRDVYCSIRSITRAEFTAAGAEGLKPEAQIVLFAYDYAGEEFVVVHGIKCRVYRTYFRFDDLLELYVERVEGRKTPPSEA